MVLMIGDLLKMIVVRRGNKFGYIDKNGKEVIPLKYTFAIPFNNYGTSVVYTVGC
ncbi:hypothetical protein MASR1M46_12360 [Bacteroidales bacterium]